MVKVVLIFMEQSVIFLGSKIFVYLEVTLKIFNFLIRNLLKIH